MSETYSQLTLQHKVQILQERLLELEAEHFRLGVMGEEALEVGSHESAAGLLISRENIDKSMSVVRRRIDDLLNFSQITEEVNDDRAESADATA